MNKLILTALVSSGLAASPLALAQAPDAETDTPQIVAQGPGAQGYGPQARHGSRGPGHGQRAFRSPTERVEAQLAYLKTALKITSAQESQWNAFADVRRKQAREAGERMDQFRSQMAERRQGGTRPTAIERMERRQAMMAVSSARLNETLAAAKPLYESLSAEQKQVADELLAPRGRGGPGHRGGGHGPRGRA